MPTKEELEQQKTDLERAIKQYADELANLTDDVKKEEKKAVILTLEQKREKILQQLITTLKEELATVSGEVEKGNLTALIEKYEREEWESQSLYAGVIAIIA
ncbi:MAG: hypothetical protein LBP53_02420 [Candidatus Peribacteria bacterium]|jgi:thioredoxin-like negative regulator of GroEL|nr:hypothetical protein [Candidatus Peribacteria bacterium]